jgi:hypothetical protein
MNQAKEGGGDPSFLSWKIGRRECIADTRMDIAIRTSIDLVIGLTRTY